MKSNAAGTPLRRWLGSVAHCFATGAAALWFAGSTLVHAGGVIVDTNGWESPTFVTGGPNNLVPSPPAAGQQGWKKASAGTGLGTATIQSSTVLNGTQALQVNKGSNSNDAWAKPNLVGFPTGRFGLVTWDMRVEQTIGAEGTLGPVFGVETYADSANRLTLLGSFGVDATTGEVLYQEPVNGSYVAPGTLVNFGAWNKYRLLLDYTQQQFRAYLNNTFIAAGEFVDKPVGNFTTLADADIVASPAQGDSASMMLPGTAYFDNFVVRDGIAGDFDQDGDVDGDDLTVWKGAVGVNANANSDGDGDSDGADLLIWQQNVGSLDYTPAVAVGAAIPEPATALLAGGALLTGLSQVRRRSAR